MKKRSRSRPSSPRQQREKALQREAFHDHMAFAAAELEAGRLEEAELEARKALRIAPGDAGATLLLGGILFSTGRAREALGLLREAVRRCPKEPALLYDLALCAVRADRLDEAEAAIRKLRDRIARDPASARGRRATLERGSREILRFIERRRRLTASGTDSAGSRQAAQTPAPKSRTARAGPPGRQRRLFHDDGRAGTPPSGTAARAATTGSRPMAPSPPPAPAAAAVERPAHTRGRPGGTDPAPAGSARPTTPAGSAAPASCLVRIQDPSPSEPPWNDEPWSDDVEERDLLLEAQKIRLVTQYEDLLCLPSLRGVERLEYQVETARKILRRLNGRALLCDEVGLGKTIEAGMVVKEYLLRGLAQSVLVLVPPGLVRQWREEMSEKFGLDFAVWDEKAKGTAAGTAPLLVIGSLALARLPRHFEAFAGREWDLVVVDEAHHVRRRSTRSWMLVNALRKRFALLLSATPVHNNLTELYELVTLVRPGLLGTRAEFRRRFGDGTGGRRLANAESLRDILSEVMVRNTRAHADVALPRRFATTLVLEPQPSESEAYRAASEYVRKAYPGATVPARMWLRHLLGSAGSGPRALADAAARRLEGGLAPPAPGAPPTPGTVAAFGPDAPAAEDSPWTPGEEGLRLLEQVREAASSGASAKAERLLQMLLASEEQVVVFCRYRATLADLSERLAAAGISHVRYHGGLTRVEKDVAIESFRAGARVLLSTESGGEGRNIQFCRTLINYDLPWDPMVIEQRVGRLHRIGQRRDVFVFNLVLAGTLEEELLRILDEKIHLFELVVGEVDSILGHLERREEFADIILDLWAGSRDDAETRRRFEEFGRELEAARASYEREKSLDEAIFSDGLEV